ncbi:hypothetical protein J4N45_09925 [Vibrio sp. SCSIO 43140]|uniref:hypothetical protein n=1 Tax=Vibrio sp. SCSIO 43140 TaxID=2819100 RepID=UPI0020756163|nr:hypothetical protein [Vibrio sp. SCSIO 43140]USD58846.1 hypothetical protein J4N45_09925 [Vibrio sp. SCSIO 43140]
METNELAVYESELKAQMAVVREAVRYAKEVGYEKASIDVSLLELLIENTTLKLD